MYENLNDPNKFKTTNRIQLRIIAVFFLIIIAIIVIILLIISSLDSDRDYLSENDINIQNNTIGLDSDSEDRDQLEKNHHRKERVILNDKQLLIVDCGGPSSDIYFEYIYFEPLPLNIDNMMTVNLRTQLNGGLHWTTQLQMKVEKLLFGFNWLKIKIPCFMGYFGSCTFSLCEMFRLHWDEQFCEYVQTTYNTTCQCPDLLTTGVFELKEFRYKPVMDRIVKYFSWFATGWYDIKFKLFDRITEHQLLCIRTHVNVEGNQ